MDTLLFAQLQPTTLAGAGSSIGDTTITLSSFKTIDGVALAMTDLGSIAYATIEPNNGTSEEQVSFTGITQNGNDTATLTGVKTVLMLAPYTETSGIAKSHIGGAKFVISNTAGFYNKMTSKANDETITGVYTFATSATPIITDQPTTDTQAANKKYVDDTAVAGAPNMALTVKGIAEEATAAEINAGTQAGSTLAELAVNPKYLKDSEYYTLRPTSDEKAALAGSGTPSAANKYVTADTDALKELLSNKDTTTTLGTSNTKYPSQLAVKTYADTKDTNVYLGSQTLSNGANTITAGYQTAWKYVVMVLEQIMSTGRLKGQVTIYKTGAVSAIVEGYTGVQATASATYDGATTITLSTSNSCTAYYYN